jgi:DNA polymerase-1
MIEELFINTESSGETFFLSGASNFRYDIYPEYKANRKGKPKPKWLEALRYYLVTDYGAEVTEGYEADDALGIAAGPGKVICSIDKDLLQIPGVHFNIVKKELTIVNPIEGLRTFYKQLVLGDLADNVPGFDGTPRTKPTIFIKAIYERLDDAIDEREMFDIVEEIYEDDLDRNANLLYIWRKENDKWVRPTQ